MRQVAARIVAAIVVQAALTACGQQPHGDQAAAAVADVGVQKTTPELHLIVTVPEGFEAPKGFVDTATVQQGTGMSLETPWVRSVKREAPSGFENLSSLSFADEASLDSWRAMHAAKLALPLTMNRARVLTKSEAAASGSAESMFKISYYSLVAPGPEFEAWVNGYLSKYLEAQRSGGILASYVMYLEEGDKGRALLVLEYPNAAAEQSAEPVKEQLSEKIAASDAEYAKQMELKESLRTTQSWTLAVPVTLAAE